jgi:hypothetical protein
MVGAGTLGAGSAGGSAGGGALGSLDGGGDGSGSPAAAIAGPASAKRRMSTWNTARILILAAGPDDGDMESLQTETRQAAATSGAVERHRRGPEQRTKDENDECVLLRVPGPSARFERCELPRRAIHAPFPTVDAGHG